MEANEFVRKHGWDKVKNIVLDFNHNSSNKFIVNLTDNSAISIYDLKRLVESHELVGRYGTADEAKEYLPMLRMDSYDELKQAILDVESCQ